ncbi:MAG: hypothetical protein JWO06_2145 [Bacteroidota bacterium]|nr:hypothetical protein [Bacteroidota bacterium]
MAIFVVSMFKSYGQDTTGFQGFKAPKLPGIQHVIKSNIIPVLIGQIPYCGELRVTYEHMITHNQSISAGFAYNFPNLFLLLATAQNGSNSLFHTYSMRGARADIGYRFYPLKEEEAPEGLFFGPYISYNFVKIAEKHGDNYQVVNYFNASGVAGYQFMFDGFSLEVFGGLGYRNNFILKYDSHINQTYTTGLPVVIDLGKFKYVKIVAQINFGYAF